MTPITTQATTIQHPITNCLEVSYRPFLERLFIGAVNRNPQVSYSSKEILRLIVFITPRFQFIDNLCGGGRDLPAYQQPNVPTPPRLSSARRLLPEGTISPETIAQLRTGQQRFSSSGIFLSKPQPILRNQPFLHSLARSLSSINRAAPEAQIGSCLSPKRSKPSGFGPSGVSSDRV